MVEPTKKKSRTQGIEDNAPWLPPPYTVADVVSIQAIAQGTANDDQQRRALKWLIEQCAKTYDLSYRPGATGDRDTVFSEGKRYVGLEIVKMLKLNPEFLRRNDT